MTPSNLAEIEERNKKASEELHALCHGKRFQMRVPSHSSDSGLTLSASLNDVATLVEAVKAKDKAIKRVLKYLRNPDDQDAELIERILDRALTENEMGGE